MLGKLFGSTKPKAQGPPPVETTIEDIEKSCSMVNKRIKVVENRVQENKLSAITKNKAGDKRGALLKMKTLKMEQNELIKLDGQLLMLEQQKMMI